MALNCHEYLILTKVYLNIFEMVCVAFSLPSPHSLLIIIMKSKKKKIWKILSAFFSCPTDWLADWLTSVWWFSIKFTNIPFKMNVHNNGIETNWKNTFGLVLTSFWQRMQKTTHNINIVEKFVLHNVKILEALVCCIDFIKCSDTFWGQPCFSNMCSTV